MAFIVHPSKVVRPDGTHIAVFSETKILTEAKEIVKTFKDKRYLLLAPAQLVCEMALALVSSVNGKSPFL